MLKLEHLFENFDLARYALTHYPHDPDRLDESLRRFRISSNAVYPFFFGGRLGFLRLCPAAEKRLSAIAAEIDFIHRLRAHGYPAMKPIPMLSGEFCRTIDTPWGRYHMSAFEGVPGHPIEALPVTDELILAYGKALGQLHHLSMTFGHAIARPTYEEIARDMRPALPPSLHPVLDAILGELAELPRTPETYGLIHYDFETDNVFYHENTQQISVIDFDDSIYHFFALDIEQALDSLSGMIPKESFPRARTLFLSAYEGAHPLPPELDALQPLMRRFIDLRTLARLRHCLDSSPAEQPEWLTGLKSMLTARCTELERRLLPDKNDEFCAILH